MMECLDGHSVRYIRIIDAQMCKRELKSFLYNILSYGKAGIIILKFLQRRRSYLVNPALRSQGGVFIFYCQDLEKSIYTGKRCFMF